MSSKQPFNLDSPILQFSKHDFWSIRDACEGTMIFGATGSGKTSGSGQAIAHGFLNSGFGGLVLTAKPDERQLWEKYCYECNCEDSLLIVSPQRDFTFNFLDYELNRAGLGAGLTENLVNLFTTALKASEGGKGGKSDDYWERTLRQLLRNTIDLIKISTGRISLVDMYQVITSAPQGYEDLESEEWQNHSRCFQCIREGENKSKSDSERMDFELTCTYWLSEFVGLAERTRSIIVSSFTSMADSLLRGVLRDLFCTQTNFVPELSQEGAIIVLDLPVKEFGELGVLSQVIFKHIWQQAVERRDVVKNPRPVFLWADECQNFISPYDQQFQTTARSSRACTVYLTQNLPNFYAALGGTGQAKHQVDSLMGNLQTKIFHANGDQVTNQWASEMFAKSWTHRRSSGISISKDKNSKSFFPKNNIQQSFNRNESLEYDILPREFTELRKGGYHNDLMVDAILFQGGRVWNSTQKNYLLTSFQQI
mgnify:CR=1 FL=1